MSQLPFADALNRNFRLQPMLKPKEDLWDIGRAALRAAGSRGRQGFGQHLDSIMQAKQQEQQRQFENEMAQYGLMWKQVEAKARAGDRRAKTLFDAAKVVVDRLDPNDVGTFFKNLDSLPDNTDPYAAVAQASQGLGVARDKESGFSLSPGQRRYDPGGKLIAEAPAKPEKPAAKYGPLALDERVGKYYQENLTTGKREWVSPPSGMELTVGEDGKVTLTTGSRKGMERRTRGDIESNLQGGREGLARLEQIAASYKPEYQELIPRLGFKWDEVKSRLPELFGNLEDADRNSLIEYTIFRREAIENINRYIKEITGAQMSAQEADRLRLAQPDPGEGVLGGDAPAVFEGKLMGAMRSLKLAYARYLYAYRNGLDPLDGSITIEDMPAIIDRRGDELEASMQDLEEEERRARVLQALSEEFGV